MVVEPVGVEAAQPRGDEVLRHVVVDRDDRKLVHQDAFRAGQEGQAQLRIQALDGSLDQLVEAKQGRTVSVCIPCRDEAATIGPLVSMVRRTLMRKVPLVDELIVLDDRSTDDTAAVAASAGATVVAIADVHLVHGEGHGKGNALWSALVASKGDFVVYMDGDVTSYQPDLTP